MDFTQTSLESMGINNSSINKQTRQYLEKKALSIRKNIIEMLVPNQSHHIGCSLSIVEILTVLYFRVLRINPKKPESINRDIFILSKGHGAASLYATLAERGFFQKSILDKYDTDGGLLPEHITKVVPGVEFSCGSLGHGLPVGAGFARSFLDDNKKNKVYVLISDGELNEGSCWEAIMFAGFHRLRNLTVIVDLNGFQGYSSTRNVLDLAPLSQKLESFRWNVNKIDGHNTNNLLRIFSKTTHNNNQPNFIIAKTIKGKGVPFFEGKFDSHYKSVDEDTKRKILNNL